MTETKMPDEIWLSKQFGGTVGFESFAGGVKYIRAAKLAKVREALESSKTHIGSTIVLRGYGEEEYSEVLKALAILDDFGVEG